MDRRGKLYFRYGTMGSAKTAILLTTAYNFEERGMEYLCLKPIIDNREKDNIIRSRIGISRECNHLMCHPIHPSVTVRYFLVQDMPMIHTSNHLIMFVL